MENILKKYLSLGLNEVVDFEKFNHIAISHHSTRIEGSTLTALESQILLTEGLTPKGKPLIETLMLTDHAKALTFVIENANEKKSLTTEIVCKINALVMQHTGNIYHTVFGEIDASKGMFRKGNVSAGDTYFPNFDKVENLTRKLVEEINERMKKEMSIEEQLHLSFDAHYNLVSIHPFYDGNGRTSRLLMNYIQTYYNLPPAIVNSEDKKEYISALIETRKRSDINCFRAFMKEQYKKQLIAEIEKYEQSTNSKRGFTFLF